MPGGKNNGEMNKLDIDFMFRVAVTECIDEMSSLSLSLFVS